MEKYDYQIVVSQLTRPMGEIRYYAKLSFFYIRGQGQDNELRDAFGETWGKTKEEAYSKMHEKVEEWILQHP